MGTWAMLAYEEDGQYTGTVVRSDGHELTELLQNFKVLDDVKKLVSFGEMSGMHSTETADKLKIMFPDFWNHKWEMLNGVTIHRESWLERREQEFPKIYACLEDCLNDDSGAQYIYVFKDSEWHCYH